MKNSLHFSAYSAAPHDHVCGVACLLAPTADRHSLDFDACSSATGIQLIKAVDYVLKCGHCIGNLNSKAVSTVSSPSNGASTIEATESTTPLYDLHYLFRPAQRVIASGVKE